MKKLILFISLIVLSFVTQATVHVVNSLNDSGAGSLRAKAALASSGDTIRFNPNLIASGSDSIVLLTGEIVFGAKGIVVKGLYNAQDTLSISGNSSSRIFSFNGAGRVVLDSVILKNGVSSVGGGGINRVDCTDTLFVKNSVITACKASSSSDGGGINSHSYSSPSAIVVINSLIKGNTSLFSGGGIASFSSSSSSFVTVINSTVSGNSASTSGGGISAYASSSSSIIIESSTISGNTVSGEGGGIFSSSYYSSYSSVLVLNSTISGNNAGNTILDYAEGGGVHSTTYYSTSPVSTVTVVNSTITENTSFYPGSGIYSESSPSTPSLSSITISSSIIAGNGSSGAGIANTNTATISSDGYNIFSDSPTGAIGSDSTNVTTSQLNLQPLAFNGGDTKTMMPGVGSMAIDNGNPSDSSDAQNAHISSIRDVGAAEVCVPTYGIDSVTACNSFTWINGITYTSNNTSAIHVIPNIAGCDSTITLNLVIKASSYATDYIIACNSYTWNGITYTSSNNSALDTLVNAVGCDSIITLDLTIFSTQYATDIHVVCDSLVWIDGNTYYSNNNTAQDTLVNALGCDSIVILDLTILDSTTSTDMISSCDPITWLDGNTYSTNNNTATHTIQNAVGCDSVVTLNFTLLPTTYAVDSVMAVNEYTWMDGVTYFSSNNTATHTILNHWGCDSVITLNLFIQFVQIGVHQNGPRLSVSADSGTFQWVLCPNYNVVLGATDSVFTPTQNGSYAVIVTQNGYTDTSDCIVVNNVGIEEPELIGVNLYPNPTSDVLNIDKGNNASLQITITNSAGVMVHQSNSSDQVTTINMAQMATGTYIVTLQNELGIKVERVIKR